MCSREEVFVCVSGRSDSCDNTWMHEQVSVAKCCAETEPIEARQLHQGVLCEHLTPAPKTPSLIPA